MTKMAENSSPNILRKKQIQTKLTFNSKHEMSLNLRTIKTKSDQIVNEVNKRLKTDDKCVEEWIEINDQNDCQTVESIPSGEPIVTTVSDNICANEDQMVGNYENKSQFELELDLTEECTENSVSVTALKTIEELQKDCLSLGLHFNTDCLDRESDNVYKAVTANTYEVESIYDSGFNEKTSETTYLVKWKDYSPDQNTWEPIANLRNCHKLLEEYNYIQKVKSPELMDDYHNYYKLKGVIEDICEKKLQMDVMTTILLVFFDVKLQDFNYTKISVHRMRRELRERWQTQIDGIENIKKIETRVESLKQLFNKLMKELFITKRFQSFHSFHEFFVKRKLIEHRLIKWSNDVNAIIAQQKEGKAIEVENFVDCVVPPHNFKYISKCETTDPQIVISDDPPIYCRDDHLCDQQTSDCCAQENEVSVVYNKNSILKDTRNRSMIYECNKLCKCSANCVNRVVQKGRKHRLAIFRTDNGKGWGVRALEPIHKGSFVMEYIGEIITIEEADRRGRVYDAEGRTYLFDLDYTPEEDNEAYKYALDATQIGNVSHFVNHSCDPNLDTRVVWINNLDPFMPHIALFAVRNIKVNEELTFDYKINVHGITDSSEGQDLNKSFISDDNGIDGSPKGRAAQQLRQSCMCGADNCKKYLNGNKM